MNVKVAYSIPRSAEVVGISRSALYMAIADGRLVARKFGKRTVVAHDDLVSFIASLPSATEVGTIRKVKPKADSEVSR